MDFHQDLRELGEEMSGFHASNGWLQNFCQRHGIKSIRDHGEAGSVDPEVAKQEKTSSRPPRNGDQRIYATTMRQDYTIDRDPPSESIHEKPEKKKSSKTGHSMCECHRDRQAKTVMYRSVS